MNKSVPSQTTAGCALVEMDTTGAHCLSELAGHTGEFVNRMCRFEDLFLQVRQNDDQSECVLAACSRN